MAFGDVRGTLTATAGSTTNPHAATGSVVVQAGDLGFAVVSERATASVGTATDNLGNTWTAIAAATDAGNVAARFYYFRFTAGGTITSLSFVASASSQDIGIAVALIEGPFTSSPLDVQPARTTNDAASPYLCPASGTLSQADEWIASTYSSANGQNVATSGLASTSPSTFIVEAATGTGSNTVSGAIAGRVVAATTSVTPQWTTTAGAPGANVMSTFSFRKDNAAAVGSAGGTGASSVVGAAIGAGVGSAGGTGASSVVGASTAAAPGSAAGTGAASAVGEEAAGGGNATKTGMFLVF